MNSAKVKNNLMLLLTALIWGSSFVAQSVGMKYIGPFTFNGVRSIIGGIVLIPCIMILDKRAGKRISFWGTNDRQSRKTLLIGGVICGAVLAVASSLQQIGILHTSVGNAGFITALYIVIVPLLGIFSGKRVTPMVWISVLIAVGGIYFLCITESFAINKADLLILLCAIFFSIHILVIDHFTETADCVRLSHIQFMVCGLLNMICMVFFEIPSFSAIFSAWVPILYAGVLSCGVAYTLQIVAQKQTHPVVASLILSLESVFAALAGWLILGQTLSMRGLVGCALVFIAIILAQLPTPKAKSAILSSS